MNENAPEPAPLSLGRPPWWAGLFYFIFCFGVLFHLNGASFAEPLHYLIIGLATTAFFLLFGALQFLFRRPLMARLSRVVFCVVVVVIGAVAGVLLHRMTQAFSPSKFVSDVIDSCFGVSCTAALVMVLRDPKIGAEEPKLM
jgi:hypothetical protein